MPHSSPLPPPDSPADTDTSPDSVESLLTHSTLADEIDEAIRDASYEPMMKPQKFADKPHAVSPFFLTGATLLCLGMAASFIPRDAELVNRLLKDGDNQRAIQLAAGHGQQVVLKALEPAAEAKSAAERTAEAIQVLRSLLQRKPLGDLSTITSVIRSFPTPEPAIQEVNNFKDQLKNEEFVACYTALADLTLANGDPKLAAQLLHDAGQHGIESEELVRKHVQSLVWSDQSASAAQLLVAWSKDHELPPDLVEQKIVLLQAANKSDLALDALLPTLGNAPAEQQLELAFTLAVRSSSLPRVIPLLERELLKFPETRATVPELAKGKVIASTEWKRNLQRCADASIWGGQMQKAFDYYLKLAATGNRPALDTLLKSMSGLNRKGDIMKLLRELIPMEDRPELEVMAAQLMADSGLYEDAIKAYRYWLQRNPKDIKAWTELAATYDELSDLEESLKIHNHILALEPKNLNSRKEKADILIGLKDFKAALDVYKLFSSAEHDPFTLENLSLLAESLADYESKSLALSMRHKLLTNPTSKDFYDLAKSFLTIDKLDEAISVLNDGMKKHPKSRLLWMTAARALASGDRGHDALVMLANPRAKTDMEALMLLIETAANTGDFEIAYNFLGNGIEDQFAFGPETLLPLSSIYFHNNQKSKAIKLLQGVEEEPTLWPLFAKTYYQQGDYAKAEGYQRQYIKTLKIPDAPAYVMLGDLCKVQGKTEEADKAYNEALQLMGQKMMRAAKETSALNRNADTTATSATDQGERATTANAQIN